MRSSSLAPSSARRACLCKCHQGMQQPGHGCQQQRRGCHVSGVCLRVAKSRRFTCRAAGPPSARGGARNVSACGSQPCLRTCAWRVASGPPHALRSLVADRWLTRSLAACSAACSEVGPAMRERLPRGATWWSRVDAYVSTQWYVATYTFLNSLTSVRALVDVRVGVMAC